MYQVDFNDALLLLDNKEGNLHRLINIRGCNGAGKSTVPLRMLETDDEAYELVWNQDNKQRVLATVFPSYNTLALGHYHSKCGGMDSIKDTDTIKKSLRAVWNLDMDVLMEGVLASTVRQTYIDLFTDLNNDRYEDGLIEREIIIYNILPPLETCLKRIQERNGGKPIKEDLVAGKWNTVKNNSSYFSQAGFNSIDVSNDGINRQDTLGWYFKNIGAAEQFLEAVSIKRSPIVNKHDRGHSEHPTSNATIRRVTDKLTKEQKLRALPKYSGEQYPLYIPTEDDIKGYDWAEFYVEPDPDTIVVNWDNMKMYWYWIHERMKIWYNRTVLRKPAPWTDDKILQENKFTNVFRDLDKGTIVYIKEILSKVDEPFTDFPTRVKEVMLNTMIYRLFLKYDTWKQIGFIYLDTWDDQWEQAKTNLRAMKARGETVWHSAYYVNDLKCCNPDPKTNGDKVENAICLCQMFYDNLDEIYEVATTGTLKDTLERCVQIDGIAYFSAYEWICDWGMAYKHVKNVFVPWTDDSDVNIGPGNKRGLDFIFENKGNLDYLGCDYYLRASWKYYMKWLGYYDDFINMLPKWTNGDINLRVIEHDCCEVQKYLNVYYGTGKCRGKFKNESRNNLDALII